MTLSKSDHIEWLYVLTGIVLAVAFQMHAPKFKAEKSDRFPACYINVCLT
jgi:hypothetical protein